MKKFIFMSLCIPSIFLASDATFSKPSLQDVFGSMSSEEVARQVQEARLLVDSLSPADQWELDRLIDEELSPYDSYVREYSRYLDLHPQATAKQNSREALDTLYSTIRMITSSDALVNALAKDDTIEAALEANHPDIIINKIKNSGLVNVNRTLWSRQNKTILEELELNIPFLCSLYEIDTKLIKDREHQ